MRLLGRRHRQEPGPEPGPLVVRPDSPALTGATAAQLASEVRAVAGQVVLDLSDIREWDSEGVAVVVELSEASGRVHVQGFAEATGRMLGVADVGVPDPRAAAATVPAPGPGPGPAQELTRLRATVVFRPPHGRSLAQRVEALVDEVSRTPDAEVLVVDLADIDRLGPPAVDAIAFASSLAAVRGVRLFVVNAAPADVDALRAVGLSAQTWVSPTPYD